MAINEVAAGKVTVDPEDLYNALNADERCTAAAEPAQETEAEIEAEAEVEEEA